MKRRGQYDFTLLLIVLLLFGIGLVMVYSSSSVIALERFGDGYYFIKKQAIFGLMGILSMITCSVIPYQYLRKVCFLALVFSLVFLVLVLIPRIGIEVRGSSRWIKILGFSFQPSEFAKLSVIIFVAHILAKKKDRIKMFNVGFLPILIITLFFAFLILKEPDFGTASTLFTISLIMMFVAGVRMRYLAGVVLAGIPLTAMLVLCEGYRMRRVLSFLDPWKNPLGDGFHLIHSFMALGSGGWFGVGLGEGKQKLFYLPEPNTDFILSVIGEEMGLIGITVVMSLFLILIVKGIGTSLKAPDLFGSYLSLGITLLIGFQAFTHAAVVMGLIPTKGLTLPFISYGGSSLITNLISAGILLNIRSQRLRR